MQASSTQTTVATGAQAAPAPKTHRFAALKARKSLWVGITLIAIFFLVLFFNTYFNITSNANINSNGTDLATTYYLSGPDPYYNMRLVQTTSDTGRFPYYSSNDPLLNYPIGKSGGRAPLMVMSAIGFSKLLVPFMSESDALGLSMQFLPALFGALLIFPVYFIGKIIFGRKEGIIAALLIAIIPIEISSGHGSAFALFDHDSINLLMYFLTFLFFLKSIKESDRIKSILYAILAGIPLAALSMIWVEAQFLYTVLAVYIIVQLIVDILLKKTQTQFVLSSSLTLFTGVLVSLPVIMMSDTPIGLPFYLALGVTAFGFVCLLFKWKNIPWVITVPIIAIIGAAAATFLYIVHTFYTAIPSFLKPINSLADILYGAGIYGSKVSLTIAEAGTYNISRTVMSYGPAVYWLGWFGFVFLIYLYIKQRDRRDYMFLLTLFVVQIWLCSTAGRFLNDMVPTIALLAGWAIWFVVAKIDYRKMLKNIQNAGGGLRGIRRGVKITHILGVLFVVFVVLVPNTFLTLDAAVPSAITKNGTSNLKTDIFGKNFTGAFGSSSYKEMYWVDAYAWLRKQDTNITPASNRPGYISWWDYGFYEVAVGDHPTVADNFQDGIPAASNFHTATSEKEGVAVWIVRLLTANSQTNGGHLAPAVVSMLNANLNASNASKIIHWVQDPKTAPSYLAPIGAQYDLNLSKKVLVGTQYPENAAYHDITQLLNDSLTDEGITWLYHNVQNATKKSIRYYGVEGYDESIFNIFAFLGDKSNSLIALRTSSKKIANPEDDFMQVKYTGYQLNTDNTPGTETSWSAGQINNMTTAQRNRISVTGTTTVYKVAYFDTMFYRTYMGTPPTTDSNGEYQTPSQQIPTYGLRHFAAVYVSPYPYYSGGKSAVVIAKYYEGAYLNGTVRSVSGSPMPYVHMIVLDKYGFPHDNLFTDQNGTFSVIAPAGNITLLMTYPGDTLLLKRIHLNQTGQFAPITDAQAMRTAGTNYQRSYSISINNSNLTGFVYNDVNNNKSYDPTVDTTIPGVSVHLDDLFFGRLIDNVTTDANGQYHFYNIPPSKYNVSAIQNGFTLNTSEVDVEPDVFWHNVSKPVLGGITGAVYFDANKNSKLDTGEAKEGTNVTLRYTKLSGSDIVAGSLLTDASGAYQFTSLVPGKYSMNASIRDPITKNLDYTIIRQVTIEPNVTTHLNLSMAYAPVLVHGKAAYASYGIGSVRITFAPDTAVQNNSAVQNTSTTNTQGDYTVRIIPGAYNVTVNYQQGVTTVYTFKGKLAVTLGQSSTAYDIALVKNSTTVSGLTTYNAKNIGNITVIFAPDGSSGNTAIRATAKSNVNGSYHLELAPGSYNVTATGIVTENGVNVTYSNLNPGLLEVKTGELTTVFTIELRKEQ